MTIEQAVLYLETMKWLKGYSNTTLDDRPIENIIDDVIALLKEQEQEIEFLKNMQRQMVDGFGVTELGEMVSKAVKLE